MINMHQKVLYKKQKAGYLLSSMHTTLWKKNKE